MRGAWAVFFDGAEMCGGAIALMDLEAVCGYFFANRRINRSRETLAMMDAAATAGELLVGFYDGFRTAILPAANVADDSCCQDISPPSR